MNYHRQSIRLQNYDYSKKNLYFITIGSYKHAYFWGEIKDNKFVSNKIGKIINNNLNLLINKFDIQIIYCQIMPNHLHCVLKINCRNIPTPPDILNNKINIAKTCQHMILMNKNPTLGQIIRFFKAKCTYEINQHGGVAPPLFKKNWNYLCQGHIFQRNYYEHIIKDEKELFKIKEYIKLNPKNWQNNKNNLMM